MLLLRVGEVDRIVWFAFQAPLTRPSLYVAPSRGLLATLAHLLYTHGFGRLAFFAPFLRP